MELIIAGIALAALFTLPASLIKASAHTVAQNNIWQQFHEQNRLNQQTIHEQNRLHQQMADEQNRVLHTEQPLYANGAAACEELSRFSMDHSLFTAGMDSATFGAGMDFGGGFGF